MRVIGAGLAVFLAVTAILLYQTSAGRGETMAQAVTSSPEPTVKAMPTTPPPSSQHTHPAPTATMTIPAPPATATPLPVEPTVEPTETTLVAEEPLTDEPDSIEDGAPDTEESAEPSAEYTADDIAEESAELAGVGTDDAWSGAIETPNGGLIGVILSGLANVRALPGIDAEVIGELHAGWPVAIYGATTGEAAGGSDVWYLVAGGGYISSALVGPYVPASPEITYQGHWVDVDLTSNIAVAYVDDLAVNAVTIISGKPGFETPVGVHTIFSRVERETLDSATVGIPVGDPEYYYLPDVPYTQYFATGGFAIHANYWSDPWQFGAALSHGCVNMFADDAAWFWWFLEIGSVVNVHY